LSKGCLKAEMEITCPFEPDPVNAGVGMDFFSTATLIIVSAY